MAEEGAGFIDVNSVLEAVAAGVRVVNLDVLTYAGNRDTLASLRDNPDHLFVQGDIGDGALVARLLAEHRPDAVVNFAAESHVDRSIDGPAAFVQTNVVGTLALLEAVRAHISEEMLGPLTAFANIDQMTKYVAKNREAMRSWAARLLVGSGLTDDSWVWDRLLESIHEITTRRPVREDVDREALATILLVAGVIGPLVFESAVPNAGEPGAMGRYARELERVLNDQARDGWQLKAITSVDVKGRIGPGGVDGALITFERARASH